MFECLLQKHGSAVACHGDRGSGYSGPGTCTMWHKAFWRRWPLTQPQSRQADDPQTEEQLYQRNSPTVKKVLGPTTDFPTWGSGKGTKNSPYPTPPLLPPLPREFDFGGQWDLITELPQDWGNRLVEGTNKTLCTPEARRKE